MYVVDDLVGLSPKELLALTPKEAALLEAIRGLFMAIKIDHEGPAGSIAKENWPAYLVARDLYLELRDLS